MLKPLTLIPNPPRGFLTSYDAKSGVEIFDLLGYHIAPEGLSPSQKAQEKALETAKRRYAQGDNTSLLTYLKRWRTWVHAGLPSLKVHSVENIIDSIVATIQRHDDANPQRTTHRPTFSVLYGHNHFMKGISSCKSNFSRHRPSL
jgi:hypothetical protein